ncbi:flagellar hook-length control protein FliK [Polymorphum gilvum]|nr:flagellar hook-length control protein FliK [Polymorphum gilvum]
MRVVVQAFQLRADLIGGSGGGPGLGGADGVRAGVAEGGGPFGALLGAVSGVDGSAGAAGGGPGGVRPAGSVPAGGLLSAVAVLSSPVGADVDVLAVAGATADGPAVPAADGAAQALVAAGEIWQVFAPMPGSGAGAAADPEASGPDDADRDGAGAVETGVVDVDGVAALVQSFPEGFAGAVPSGGLAADAPAGPGADLDVASAPFDPHSGSRSGPAGAPPAPLGPAAGVMPGSAGAGQSPGDAAPLSGSGVLPAAAQATPAGAGGEAPLPTGVAAGEIAVALRPAGADAMGAGPVAASSDGPDPLGLAAASTSGGVGLAASAPADPAVLPSVARTLTASAGQGAEAGALPQVPLADGAAKAVDPRAASPLPGAAGSAAAVVPGGVAEGSAATAAPAQTSTVGLQGHPQATEVDEERAGSATPGQASAGLRQESGALPAASRREVGGFDGAVVADGRVGEGGGDGAATGRDVRSDRPGEASVRTQGGENGPTAPAAARALAAAELAAVASDAAQDGGDGAELQPLSLDARGSARADAMSLGRASAQGPSAQAQAAAAQIAGQIVHHLRNGQSRFQMRLDPPELGRVEVHMRVSSEGVVQAHLVVERSETLDLFLRDQRGLERALEQAGLRTDSGSVQFSLRDQGGSQFTFADQGREGQARSDSSGDETAETSDPGDIEQVVQLYRTGGRSGLDIRV